MCRYHCQHCGFLLAGVDSGRHFGSADDNIVFEEQCSGKIEGGLLG